MDLVRQLLTMGPLFLKWGMILALCNAQTLCAQVRNIGETILQSHCKARIYFL